MNIAVINIKTNPKVKAKAQKVASELGFSLSALLNGYMRHLIKTRTVYFSAKSEEPSEYLLESLSESEEDIKNKDVSPSFENAKDAVSWLRDRKKKW